MYDAVSMQSDAVDRETHIILYPKPMYDQPTYMGGARLFLLGGVQRGQGAGHVGADISHGRAIDGCMDDNWGEGSWGGSPPPLEPPMLRSKRTMCYVPNYYRSWAGLAGDRGSCPPPPCPGLASSCPPVIVHSFIKNHSMANICPHMPCPLPPCPPPQEKKSGAAHAIGYYGRAVYHN